MSDSKKIKVWYPPRASWVKWELSFCDQIEIEKDLQQIIPNFNSLNVVVDMLQSNESCSIDEILEYNKIFDRIVLINCETRNDVLSMAKQFDLSKVCFISLGYLNYEPQHMKIIGIETVFGEVRKLYHKTDYAALAELATSQSKPYYFDALLGMPKLHRDFIYKKIQENYKDKIYTRYQRQNQSLSDSVTTNNWVWPTGAEIISQTDQKNWYSGNQIQFGDMITNISNVVPITVYNDTYYSIVAETHYTNDYVMLTEKTAKPLIAKRLFVMFAGLGYLAHLHRLGFQTFDSIIDESYDLEIDDTARWTKAFDQVQYLCGQSHEMVLQKIQPILDYNYNLFVSRDWNEEFRQAIITSITEF